MRTVAQQLADLCTGFRFERLPVEVVERTKDLLLDYLGVCYRGALVESSEAAQRAVRALSGPGKITVVGQAQGASAAWAALANGASAHAIEMDDVTSKSSLHPAVAVFPAALALAEELSASPDSLLVAAIAGYEVTMRLGNALNPASAYARGFHPTGVAGAFGATAAGASLLGLGPDQFANALGIAGTMASGSLEYLSGGAWTKRLNAGWAAHCGVVAARLAAEGFTGPATAVEGPLGLLHAYTEKPYPSEATTALGDGYQVMKVSIKPYACCRYNHGLIDCVLQLRARVSCPGDVVEIRLGVLRGGYLLVADPHRTQAPAAQRGGRTVQRAIRRRGGAGPWQSWPGGVHEAERGGPNHSRADGAYDLLPGPGARRSLPRALACRGVHPPSLRATPGSASAVSAGRARESRLSGGPSLQVPRDDRRPLGGRSPRPHPGLAVRIAGRRPGAVSGLAFEHLFPAGAEAWEHFRYRRVACGRLPVVRSMTSIVSSKGSTIQYSLTPKR
jgi:2-methylcitrate dehydratase PrpD